MTTALSDSGVMFADGSVQLAAALPQILSLPNPTLAANAMTLPAVTMSLAFRSANAFDGTVGATVTGVIAALTIPSTATLGTVSAVASTLIEVVMNNAGTMERAVINLAGGNDLSEMGFINTTAISAAATANNVFYSNTARANLPYRVVRRIDSTQATAGTWVTAPSLIQGVGGQALNGKISPVQSMIRLNTTNGFGSTNTFIRRWLNTTSIQGTDITYTDSATLGATFTINVTGVYAFMYNDVFSSGTNFGLSLNSSQLTTAFDSININDRLSYFYTSAADFTGAGGGTFYLAAGSIVRCHVGAATNSVVPARSAFAVTRVA